MVLRIVVYRPSRYCVPPLPEDEVLEVLEALSRGRERVKVVRS
ncbi:MAG: hypothetical protein QXX81_05385 [Zestosphaera sp.]